MAVERKRMETTRGGKWRACKRKNAAKHEGGGGGEAGENSKSGVYTRILFQYFKRTPGYHAYPRVDGQYLKRTTNVAWLAPPLSTSRERETNSSRASEKIAA